MSRPALGPGVMSSLVPGLDSAYLKDAARAEGFHGVGIARAEPLDPGPLDRFLERGWDADMAWMRARRAERLDPARLFPGARSVVALALGYFAAADEPAAGDGMRVARYARGRDYHRVMKEKLAGLVARIRARDPRARTFASSDIAPVMERAWAQRAGIGWVGKNGCLITTDLGSWVLLATVLVDRDLEPDAPHPERCGRCQACLAACPTGAIPEPGSVDSRRCLSYQSIERRGPVPEEIAERWGEWGFGCDDCQSICPWNRKARPSADPQLAPRPGQSLLSLSEMLRLTPEDYRRRFNGTALARARYEGLVRNAVLCAGRGGDPRHAEAIREYFQSQFPGVRAAAAWAISRVEGPGRARRSGGVDPVG